MEVAGKEGNLQEVSGSGMRGEIAHLHILGHALTKACHGKLLCEMEWAASSISMISHRSLVRKECRPGYNVVGALDTRARRAGLHLPRSGLVQTNSMRSPVPSLE